MACKSCAERRARMKAWLKERFRVEEIHRKAKQQAGRSRPQHQQQEVEGDQGAGPGRAAAVSDMPEAGQGGPSGGRGSQGQRLTQSGEVEPVGSVPGTSRGEDVQRGERQDVEGEGLQ